MARLPKLQLKPFKGDRLKFQEFWESFDNAVHSDPKIDKITKYTYLRTLLEGEAAVVISGYPLTAKNYDDVVTALKSRYGNRQVLVSAHIDQILNLPTVTTSSDTKKLRELYDEIEVNVRS